MITVWHMGTGECRHTIEGHRSWINALRWNEEHLVLGGGDAVLSLVRTGMFVSPFLFFVLINNCLIVELERGSAALSQQNDRTFGYASKK